MCQTYTYRWPDSIFHMTFMSVVNKWHLNVMWFDSIWSFVIWIHIENAWKKKTTGINECLKNEVKMNVLTYRIECNMKTKSKNQTHELFMIGNYKIFLSIFIIGTFMITIWSFRCWCIAINKHGLMVTLTETNEFVIKHIYQLNHDTLCI